MSGKYSELRVLWLWHSMSPGSHSDLLQSFPKETQHFWSCVSLGEECIRVNLGLCIILTMLMVTTCWKPHFKIDHGSLMILKCLHTSHVGEIVKLNMQISHDPRLHDPDPGPQEKSTEKSCVSFGKDCIPRTQCVVLTDLCSTWLISVQLYVQTGNI